ncbi:DHA2 family efflux MFS transporter permease subunit [Streptacidiphilus sp. PB12-B1b]|uniref:DHA2 family efflux MFS transporter permease subunit n=1 Tax=Streptacidiphilus sp. PB12-B1b TaxID=2705012 RepID=UPI0015F7FC72|nr:DHA2 family efflux MFS transporter permease subunit [Streptacidiphilus sp. PB12-B1b]QMU75762.1 DHA2 family efflux MFS transporter permease subunit [Streptacidiphilus sp. PB12-B1b]
MTTTSPRPETGDSTAGAPASAASRLALVVASGATFLAVLDTTVVNVAFPSLRSDFRTEPLSHLTWVITAYTVVFAALLAVAGRVADILGRRRLFLISTSLFTVASLLSGVSPNLPTLVAARTLQGIAAAGMIPAALGLVLAHTAPARRAAAIGVWGAVGSMAAAVGPSLGGLLVNVWGWRAVFLINLPLGVVFVGLAVRGVSADAPSGRRMPDPVGVVALALGMSGLVFGVTQGSAWGWGSGSVLTLLIGGALLTALALALSRRHVSPAIEWDLWQSRTFAGTNLTSLLFGAAMYAYLLSTLLFLNTVWGYSELKAGLAVTPGAFSAAAGAMVVGRRIGPAKQWLAVLTGSALFAGSCALMYLLLGTEKRYLALWLPIGVVAGVGIGAALTGLSTAAARSLPPERFASGTGLLMTARQAGGALGIAALAAILQHSGMLGDKGYLDTFLACAGCSAVAAVSALTIRRRGPE